MRAIMVMFDTLTRKFLPNYGCGWTNLPNFKRLEQNCTRFDNFYGGSLPCMPARREHHTGKYNFLRRSWGPLEPFDRSGIEAMRAAGIYTHLVTDHSHYWEDGGATYHNRYDTWEGFRGQEGDRYVPHDIQADIPKDRCGLNKTGLSVNQHYRNRLRQQTEQEMSGAKTVHAGIEFLKEHASRDGWFLQVECFDPHEPFYVPQRYRQMYGLPEEETLNWPRYGMAPGDDYRQELENAKREYAALMTMCDAQLGKILDFMDEQDMWKDTALIVNTDHGFLLGEHECMGKNFSPVYDELVHIPFFLHMPGQETGEARSELCSSVDLMPTLLDLFGCETSAMGEMDGTSMRPVIEKDEAIHDYVLFGMHGSYTCCTDGHMVYMKANATPANAPLYEYTLMPTNIRGYFTPEQLNGAELVPGSRFTNGLPCLRIPASSSYLMAYRFGDRLYDLDEDPGETKNLLDQEQAKKWNGILTELLERVDAPEEEYVRLGIEDCIRKS